MKRRVHPLLLVAGGVAAWLFFGGFFDGGTDFVDTYDAPPTTFVISDFESTTTAPFEDFEDDFEITTTTAFEQSGVTGIESAPTTTPATYIQATPDLLFELTGCEDGFLQGLVINNSRLRIESVSFVVYIDPNDGGGSFELAGTKGPLVPLGAEPFSLPWPQDLTAEANCQDFVLDVEVN